MPPIRLTAPLPAVLAVLSLTFALSPPIAASSRPSWPVLSPPQGDTGRTGFAAALATGPTVRLRFWGTGTSPGMTVRGQCVVEAASTLR